MSEGMIDETCRLCGVSALDSKDLARILRAIARSRQTEGPWSIHLAVADGRTLKGLCGRAGLASHARQVSLREFLANQKLIPTSKPCLRELCHLAANSPLFF